VLEGRAFPPTVSKGASLSSPPFALFAAAADYNSDESDVC
jgi:hypothetical protein